jgi:hypothetical protein
MDAALLNECPNKMLVATGLCVFSAVVVHRRCSGGEGLLQVAAPAGHQITRRWLHSNDDCLAFVSFYLFETEIDSISQTQQIRQRPETTYMIAGRAYSTLYDCQLFFISITRPPTYWGTIQAFLLPPHHHQSHE